MLKRVCRVGLMLLMASLACAAPPPKAKPPKKVYPETTEPAEAQKDPSFVLQGEYLGTGTLHGQSGPIGAQVIALEKGAFKAVLFAGGLPGAGWKRGGKKWELSGQRKENQVVLSGEKLAATIDTSGLTLSGPDGQTKAALQRSQRQSPTMGAKPPQGAIVLFDGKGTEHFTESHGLSPERNLVAGVTSEPLPERYHLHLEFRLSYMPTALGQARSNSGVYVHDCYEIQVLDSFGLEGKNNECGGFYSIREPNVNMCLPPLAWQTYDIDFSAPKFDAAGKKTANARITVVHNGVPIHADMELPKDTPGRKKEGPGMRPLHLQGHGCHVQFRNIWAVAKP